MRVPRDTASACRLSPEHAGQILSRGIRWNQEVHSRLRAVTAESKDFLLARGCRRIDRPLRLAQSLIEDYPRRDSISVDRDANQPTKISRFGRRRAARHGTDARSDSQSAA